MPVSNPNGHFLYVKQYRGSVNSDLLNSQAVISNGYEQ